MPGTTRPKSTTELLLELWGTQQARNVLLDLDEPAQHDNPSSAVATGPSPAPAWARVR
jgi:hypothetical protein